MPAWLSARFSGRRGTTVASEGVALTSTDTAPTPRSDAAATRYRRSAPLVRPVWLNRGRVLRPSTAKAPAAPVAASTT